MKQAKTTKQPLEEGQKYHIDIEFEGERLVDDVTIIGEQNGKDILVDSPYLQEHIMIPVNELKSHNLITDSKEGLHTQGFGKLELWEDSIEKDFFYSLKAYTKDGLQTIVRTETPLKKDKENCEYILKAVNERKALLEKVDFQNEQIIALNSGYTKLVEKNKALLDSHRELLRLVNECYGYFSAPNFTDRYGTAERLKNAINNAKNI